MRFGRLHLLSLAPLFGPAHAQICPVIGPKHVPPVRGLYVSGAEPGEPTP